MRRPTLWTHPYLWTALPVLALLVTACVHLPWGGDYGVHAATIERLRDDPVHPGNPMVAENTASPYYSPSMLALALIAKATGWSTTTVLSLGALVAVSLLVSGVWRFTRALTSARWAPALLLLCVTLMWGTQLFAWSGFLSLSSLTRSVGYPATMAWALTLHLWAWLPRAAERDWPLPSTAGLGVFAAVIVLAHQFTGVTMLVGVAAFAVGAPRGAAARRWPRLLVGAAVTTAVLAAWPYYPFFGLDNPPGEDAAHQALYANVLWRYGFVLLGFPAFALRLRRQRLDPLVLLFCGCAAVYALGRVTGHYAYGRVLPGAMFAAQAALAVEVAERSAGPVLRRALTAVTALALACGLWVQGSALSYAVDRDASLARHFHLQNVELENGYGWIRPYVRSGSVTMTDDFFAQRRVPLYGGYVVFCPYPDPFLADWRTREADTDTFFASVTTPAERAALLAKYHVNWIIQTPGEQRVDLSRWYPRVATGPTSEVLYRVGP
ncbi:hypothetical protein [Streptomyces sp. NPDC006333]|uniref:hypothetical protein n=1 Tax=Streptomyces sp. NPDC006333 TaxID=3156753 RepID=UPI0033ACE27D